MSQTDEQRKNFEDDMEEYVTEYMGVLHCEYCKHYWEADKCPAFPDGIPIDIMVGIIEHREPYVGDGGVRFEEIDEAEKKKRRLP